MEKATPKSSPITHTHDYITKPPENILEQQRQDLIDELKKRDVSTIDARDELNIMHPAGRIKELREEGHNISIKLIWQDDKAGRPHKIGLYHLEREEIADAG